MSSKPLAVLALALSALLGGAAVRAASDTAAATTIVLLDTPCRAFDEAGVRITAVDLGECGVPGEAVGVKLNVTVAQASAPLYVSVNEIGVQKDDGTVEYETSIVNAQPGLVNSNTVDVAVQPTPWSPSIPIAVAPYADGVGRNARIIVDVLGWYESS